MIQYFNNDMEKLMNAFYPLFRRWVQSNFGLLKKFTSLSVSAVQVVYVESAQCGLFNTWLKNNGLRRTDRPAPGKLPHHDNVARFLKDTLASEEYKYECDFHCFLCSTPNS